MRKFLIRRLLLGILVVVCGAFIIYLVIRCLPSSYVETLARQRASNPTSTKTYQEWLAQLNAVYHLDGSIISGFFSWLINAVQGNFGESWEYGIEVTQKFKDVIWWSVLLNFLTLFVELFVSIPLGIVAAKKQYSKTDYTVTTFALLSISLPSFFLATLCKFFFAVKLGWFETAGITGRYFAQLSTWGQIGDILWHLVMPVFVLSMLSIGGLMRYTRTNMLEVLNADYIRTARAKGLPEKKVIKHHAFRNTLIPLVTMFSGLIPSMFGGAMITEELFQIPGIGRIAYVAITKGDIPFAMFYNAFLLILTQVSLIIADIMYAVVDPRVRIN